MDGFEKRLNESLILLYDFVRNPFHKPIDKLEDDKSLVFLASVLSGIIVIVKFLNTPMDNWVYIAFLIGGLLLTPLFGLLVVHFKGAVFGLYLTFVAAPLFKVQLNDFLKAKQIMTFSSIGLIVSSVPSLSNVGIVIGLAIQVLGLIKLFNVSLIKSLATALIYSALWMGVIFLIATGTAWI
ncbi:hypothetical protein [Marinilabilia sp.]|uniref:hypothetical protein n=1 Tax=Marinilabilia sp. TaxID=2021252 RepID=UPI0025C270A1|nr:hypothetical protein [Marinilabilia sp.]